MLYRYSDPPELKPETVYLLGEELIELTNYWVRQLGLQGWQIDVRVVQLADMPAANAQGCARWELSLRQGVVHLLDPRDHRPGESKYNSYDMETTLVHELLHVMFSAWHRVPGSPNDDGVLEAVCSEQPIDRISMALVALRRATETKKNRKGVRG